MRKACLLTLVAFGLAVAGCGGVPAAAPQGKADLHHPDELPDLRTETSWTKALPDGRRQAHISTAPIHYRDTDGALKQIDLNVVAMAKNDIPTAAYGVEKNLFKTYFPARAGEGVVVELKDGTRVGLWHGTAIEFLDVKRKSVKTLRAAVSQAIPQENTVQYTGSFGGANERFAVTASRLKHELVLTSDEVIANAGRASHLAFQEGIVLDDGLTLTCGEAPVVNEALCGDAIHIRDASGTSLAHFPRPTYWDSGARDELVARRSIQSGHYQLVRGDGSIFLRTLVPIAWLSDRSRVYPVTIDPTLSQNSNADSDVIESYPSSNNGTWTNMFVGFEDGSYYGYGRERAFVKADLSSIPVYATVTAATFKAYVFNGDFDYSTINYNVSRVQSSWSETGITWNNQPGLDAPESTIGMAWGVVNYVSWNIPVMAQNWVANPGQNYGLAIRAQTETPYTLRIFYSKDNGSNIPNFTVDYNLDTTPPAFQSAAVNGARYNSGGDYWVRGGDSVTVNIRHLDNQSGVRIQQADLYDGACNSWLDHYYDDHHNDPKYSPGGCNHVTWPAPTAEEIENSGGYTTTRFTANIATGLGDLDFPVVGRAWDYAGNDSGLNGTGLTVKIDDSNPAGSGLAPSGGVVAGTVSVSVTATDARSGVKDVTFYIGNAACSGGWNSLGAGTPAGSTYSTNWDTSSYAEGVYCVRADIRDNVDRTVTVTSTTTLDKNAPTVTNRAISKSSILADGNDSFTVTIAASDTYSAINFIEGGFNYDGNPSLAQCQSAPPNPPCRGIFGWSPSQAYLTTNGFTSIVSCAGGGYAGLLSGWGDGYLRLPSCVATVGSKTASVDFTLKLDPSYGEQTGNWVAALAADAPGNVSAAAPLTPAAPLFDVTLPPPGAPTWKAVAAFTKGTSIYLEWNAASDPYSGIKDYEVARTNTPAEAQSCGATPPAGYASSGAVAGLSYTFSSLTDGQKFCYWVRARNNNNKYSSWAGPVSSTQDNTAPTCALGGITGTAGIVYFNAPGKKVYYNNSSAGGAITVVIAPTDSVSGVAKVSFPTIGGFTGSGDDTAAPYQSSDVSAYAFTTLTSFGGAAFAICADGVGNQNTATYNVERDVAPPDGGAISYPDGTFSGAAITVQYDEGTDFGSGIGSIQIQRAEATYGGGACGSFGPFSNAGNQTVGGLQWVDVATLANHCYRYQAVVKDNVGNAVVYTSTATYVRIPGVPADPNQSTIGASPSSIVADGASTSTITVTAVDTNSQNMGPGQAVVITVTSGTGTLLGAVQDMGNGSYTQKLQSDTKPGSGTAGAAINGVTLTHTAAVTYTVGPLDKDKSDVTAVPASITADGVSTAKVVVTPMDAAGNKIGKGLTVGVALVAGTGTLTGAIVDKNDGTYEQTVTAPLAAGSGEFEADVGGTKITKHATITYVPGTASKLAFATPPQSSVTAGAVFAPFTVAVQDANGNTVTTDNSTQVTLSLDAGTGTILGTTTRTAASGVAAFDDIAYRKAETIRFRASAAQLADAVSGDITVTAGAADHVALAARSASVLIGQRGDVDIAVKDRFENVAAAAVAVTVTANLAATLPTTTLVNPTGTGTSTVTGTTGADGKGTITVTDLTPEVVTLSVDGQGLPEASPNVGATVQFVRETPDHVALTAPAGSVKAGDAKVITVQVKDKNDVDLPAQAAVTLTAGGSAQFTATTLDSPAGLNTGTLSGTVPATGTATATVTDTKAETVAVTPSDQLPKTMPEVPASVIFVPNVPAGTVALTATPPKIRADGVSSSTVASGVIADQYGNTQPDGTLITVAASKGAVSTKDADPGRIGIQVATAAGAISFSVVSDATPGTATASIASVDGNATGSTTVDFVANGAPTAEAGPDQSVVSGDTVTLDGSGSTDPDGDPLTFAWTQTAGPGAALSDATAVKPTFAAPDVAAGTDLTFALVVNDGYGDSAPDTVKVTVTPRADAKPVITSTPATKGTTGAPYHYDANDAAEASGRAPITWSRTKGPSDFTIDPATGAIAWTPLSFGPTVIAIKAENAYGGDEQTFTVDVDKGVVPDKPVAVIGVDKPSGDAPLTAAFDGAKSTAGKGAALVQYLWEFGDGGSAAGKDATVSHTYLRPGGYQAKLTVVDDWGQSASAQTLVTVTSGGKKPPKAKIVADKTSGEAPLQVSFSCDCTDDGTIVDYLWDFGDGGSGTIEKPAHVFQTGGTYPVQLTVRDNYGLQASDKIFVSVTAGGKKPPSVTITASTGAGEAPLKVDFEATITKGDGAVVSSGWAIDGAPAGGGTALTHTFDKAGLAVVSFTVTDENQLTASDAVTISVLKNGMVPPKIITTPGVAARAGLEYDYEPKATGDRPIAWVVKGPGGMKADGTTGYLTWTPPKDSAKEAAVTLTATNAAGQDDQTWTIAVSGAGEGGNHDGGSADGAGASGESAGGCSCSTAGDGPGPGAVAAFLLIAGGLIARRVRRRR